MMKQTKKTNRHLDGAIIGFGNMAEKGHLPGWQKEKRVSIQAVCEPNRNRRKRAKELLPHVRVYSRAEELFENESLDFVDVCTPPPFHAENMMTALQRDLHVLCEKPFVGTTGELRRIMKLCDRKQRIAFPVHNWKHAPILARAREWIDNGLLGRILYSEFHTLRTQPAVGLTPWRSEKENAGGGGILLDHGWHVIYLLLNFHAERPEAVSTWLHPCPSLSGQAEQTAHLLMEFPSSTATLFLTWNASRRYNSARIYGDRGFVTLEDNRIALHRPDEPVKKATFQSPLSHGSHHPGWFGPVVKNFLSAMESSEEARRELEEARLCLEITRLGYESSQKGGRRLRIPS